MVGRKYLRWNKLAVAALLSAVFVITGLIGYVPTASAAPVYNWTSPTNINVTGFTKAGGNTTFDFKCSESGTTYTCVPVGIGGCMQIKGTLVVSGNAASGKVSYYRLDEALGCVLDGSDTVSIGNTAKASSVLTGGGTSTSGANAEADTDLQCGKINALNWILCPFIKGINFMVNQLDSLIIKMLTVDQAKIFDTATEPTAKLYYSAWETFRGFALALLLIAGLFMVIAQALGFETLDAYTMKKILPRLLVAIIGIALSWEIMEFFVTAVNNIGLGVRQVIMFPFRDFAPPGQLGLGASGAVGALTAGALIAMGPVALLSFGLTAVIGVAIAFLVLVIRQLVIVVLILFAPIAIAAYILPNTQGIWKLWYESFTKAMMMFPIIVAFLSVGKVFSITATSGSVTDGAAVGQLIGFAAYFMPYFLIPLTFRFAGGALRTIGGMTNDKGRGGFDRLKKFRGNQTARNMEDLKHGNRFKGEGYVRDKFNRTTGNIAALPSAGLNPLKMKQRLNASQSNQAMLAAGEYGEKNAPFQAIKGNDDFLNAGLEGKSNDKKVFESLKRKGYDDNTATQATAAIRAARRDVSPEVFETAATLALPSTGTAFKGEGGAAEMHEAINNVAGDDRVKAGRMLAAMRSGAGQARRFEIAGGGFGDQITTLDMQYNDTKAINENQNMSPAQKAQALGALKQRVSDHIVDSSLEGQGGSYVAGARKSAVEVFAPAMVRALNNKVTNGTTADIDRELAVIAGRYDGMASVSPENARVMATEVMGKEININGVTQTIQQHVEERRTPGTPAFSESFIEMRREYGAGAARNGAAAQQAAQQAGQGPQGPPVPPVIPPSPN